MDEKTHKMKEMIEGGTLNLTDVFKDGAVFDA